MGYYLLAIGVGIVCLVWGANRFIDGATAVAEHLGMPPLLIGIVIMGFGNSTPELLVSATAAFHGNTGIALGNAVGSNISNLALNLGICALLSPILVKQSVLNRELPILLGVSLLWMLLIKDGHVSRIDGVILLAAFVAAVFVLARRAEADSVDSAEYTQEVEESLPATPPKWGRSILSLVLGLGVMLGSSELLVWGAEHIAAHFGVNELIIGLTIVAVGTSLPELASSIIAARRGEHDLALGNVLGAVIFNLMAVVGTSALIRPLAAEHDLLHRDIAVLAIVTVLVCIFCLDRKPPLRISRGEAAALLAIYVSYTLLLLLGSQVPGAGIELW